MNSYSVLNCTYDGTSGDPNPLCLVLGSVNGTNVFPLVFFRYLMAASVANQMQQALTIILFNWYATVFDKVFPEPLALLMFPPSAAVAQHTSGPYPVPPAVVPQALIGSWQA